MELYDKENGIRGGGGLGVLVADARRIAERMGLPFVVLTPFYPQELRQRTVDGEIVNDVVKTEYADYGYVDAGMVSIKCNSDTVTLNIIRKDFEKTSIVAVTEPNFGVLYQGKSESEHRLYQEVALGFGGYKALKLIGLQASLMQMNEAATAFLPLATLDAMVAGGENFDKALLKVRQSTLYTNHTLLYAAEAVFTLDQFEKYVFTNIQSRAVESWVKGLFVDGTITLSKLALALSMRRNAVSRLHAERADYVDECGRKVFFEPITNGIDMEKWVLPEIMEKYRELGAINKFGRVLPSYRRPLARLTPETVLALKARGREVMNEILKSYPDQYGKTTSFRSDDIVFVYKRRLVTYKRPDMLFLKPEKLRSVLEPVGAHYILAGRVHAGDEGMVGRLKGILRCTDEDDYLRTHVHYLADYDERLAYGLSVGCDVTINVPKVGLEACGTSWMKDIANLQLLISTPDGGVADVDTKYYWAITEKNYFDEIDEVCAAMSEAIKTRKSKTAFAMRVRLQLDGFLPIVSGERMLDEYLEFVRTT